MKNLKKLALGSGLGVVATAASAEPVSISVADVVAQIAAASTPIAAVGGAVLAVVAIAITFKLIRRAF